MSQTPVLVAPTQKLMRFEFMKGLIADGTRKMLMIPEDLRVHHQMA